MKFKILLFSIFIEVNTKYVPWPSSSTANELTSGATVEVAPLNAPTSSTVPPSSSIAAFVLDDNDCIISAPGVVESGGCSNGGRCMQGAQKRYCLCKEGWGGLTCDQPLISTTLPSFVSSTVSATTRYKEKHLCQPGGQQCKNGGQCRVDPSNAKPNECVCVYGWAGSLCEEDDPSIPLPDECSNIKKCVNGGQCQPFKTSQKICRCNLPFGGKYCEQVHHCMDDDTCRNGGKCVYSSGRRIYVCICALPYTGLLCQTSSATVTVDLPITATAKVAVCNLLEKVPYLKPLSDALKQGFEDCSFTVNPSIKVTFVQQSNL